MRTEQIKTVPTIVIRRIAEGDAEALMAFYNGLSEASKRTFRPLGVETRIEDCRSIVGDNRLGIAAKYDLVATAGSRIVGWGFLWDIVEGEPTFGLGIADAFQSMGLGSRLLDHALDMARKQGMKKVRLTVVQDNHRAQHLYESRGFVRYDAFTGDDGLPYYRMENNLEPV